MKLFFSKSSKHYLDQKNQFFNENTMSLEKALNYNAVYSKMAKRQTCKICRIQLGTKIDFSSHGIDYIFCRNSDCQHLNGAFEDSEDFIKYVYSSDGESTYGKNYIDEKYDERTISVYKPKLDFLTANIPEKVVKILDVGAGAGHFVYSALRMGHEASGIDLGNEMVQFGNEQIFHRLKLRPLSLVNESDLLEKVRSFDGNVISAIGVIEHLREPERFFSAFRESSTKYLFYSVPMFSLSVFIENSFQSVFPRQLSGGHTHLFTEKSFRKMNDFLGIASIAEWRFGTDILDLFRSLMVLGRQNYSSDFTLARLSDFFLNSTDQLQSVLDKNYFCSEIHVIAQKSV